MNTEIPSPDKPGYIQRIERFYKKNLHFRRVGETARAHVTHDCGCPILTGGRDCECTPDIIIVFSDRSVSIDLEGNYTHLS